MKNYLSILAIILAGSALGFGQTAAKPAEKTGLEKKETATAKTDKFDPLRDPAADLKEAVTKARGEGKRIIIDVGGEWCSWCHFLDNFFAKNPGLLKLREDNYVWLKVNMSRENENTAFLAAYPEIAGYPHLFVLDSDGALLHSQPTNVLELGKSYNLERVTDFLNKWAPPKPGGK